MYPRFLERRVREVLSISPAVLVSGARQVGKSTLAMKLFPNYVLLDDIAYRASAEEDPAGFVEMLRTPVCIDEIQKVPRLLEAIKTVIDRDRRNGMFLLTGSASVLDMKGVGIRWRGASSICICILLRPRSATGVSKMWSIFCSTGR